MLSTGLAAHVSMGVLFLALAISSTHADAADTSKDSWLQKEVALMGGLEKQGRGFVSNVHIGTNKNGIRGMFASRDIPKVSVGSFGTRAKNRISRYYGRLACCGIIGLEGPASSRVNM